MAAKIRLKRAGTTNRPYYHMVIADSRAPRDGKFIEKIGIYNPLLPVNHEERLRVNIERAKYWVGVGAQPSEKVAKFLARLEVIEPRKINPSPKKSAPRARTVEKAAERAKKEADRAG